MALKHKTASAVLRLAALLALPAMLLAVSPQAQAQLLTQDSSYTCGELDNGLTYYIRHNSKEPGLADFYIAQRVGSVLEEPRQRGLAHFLEHMAFNGSENFGHDGKPGIVPWCESIGVKFGANLNAYTSVDQTVYHVGSVPLKREGIIDSALLILHDWSHYLLLTDQEIDKERGVIHEEWRTRDAGKAVGRMMEHVLPTVYAGTKYADCLPIGSMEIVDNFPYADLRDYYHKWYRPDLQAVIVVGDVDVKSIESKIRSMFGGIPMPTDPAKRDYYPVSDNDTMIVAVDRDAEQPIILATLHMKRDATPDSLKGTEDYLRGAYVDRLITTMLNDRLQEIKNQAHPPFLSANVSDGSFLVSRTKDAFALHFGCRQESISGSVYAAVGAVEQARQHGFTEQELSRAKSLLMKSAEKLNAERDNRRNSYFVKRALNHFLDCEPLITDDCRLSLYKKWDAQVSLADVNAEARSIISDRNQVLTVYAPDKPDLKLPCYRCFRRFVLHAQDSVYQPYADKALPADLMERTPKPGSVVKQENLDRWGVTLFTLSNGVKVYVKPTEFDRDNITMRFWSEGGLKRFPDADQPNFAYATSAVTGGGVGRFSAVDLTKMLNGKNVRVSPSIGYETQSINGSSSVKDLETMLQLTHLYFTSPRRDEEVFQGELNRMHSFLTNREANPNVSYNDTILKIVYGDSPRRQPTKRETLSKVSFDRCLQMYRECFSDASGFSMLLVGNVDIDSLRPLLEKYVASLPATEENGKASYYDDPDVVGGDITVSFKKKMNTPSALVTIFYTFEQPFTSKSDITIDILDRVLTIAYTDSVREEKGGTYGVGVDYSLDATARPSAMLKIKFRTDPAKYAELTPIVYRQVDNIAKRGPEPAALDKAKAYLHKAYQQNIISNGYWDYVIYNYLRHGIDYDSDYDRLVDSVTAADLRRVASEMLDSHRRIEVTMLSE